MKSTCACEMACCQELYLAHCCLVLGLVAVWGPAPCLQGSHIKHPGQHDCLGCRGGDPGEPSTSSGSLSDCADLSVSPMDGRHAAQPELCNFNAEGGVLVAFFLSSTGFGTSPSVFAKIKLGEAQPLVPDTSMLLEG